MVQIENISIPNNESTKFKKAIEVIGNHWGFENKSQIIRESVYQIMDWIGGSRELVRSNRYSEEKQSNINKEYINEIWSKLKKDVTKYSKEQFAKEVSGVFKTLLLVLENVSVENERLRMKYEQ